MASIRTFDAGATHSDGAQLGASGEKVGFYGTTPATQPASANQTAVTDNTGGSVADAIAAVVTAPTAIGATLTDSTGDSGTHDDTLADGLTTTAFVADNGGATADGTVEAMTGLPVAVDLSNMEDGSADNVLEAILDTSTGDRSGPIERNFDKIGDEINSTVLLVTALANNVQECVDKIQTITTDLTVQNQNDSDLAQKVIELVTAQAADRAAIVALTDGLAKTIELTNAIRSALVTLGVIKGSA